MRFACLTPWDDVFQGKVANDWKPAELAGITVGQWRSIMSGRGATTRRSVKNLKQRPAADGKPKKQLRMFDNDGKEIFETPG